MIRLFGASPARGALRAKGRVRHVDGKENKTEARYDGHLYRLQLTGAIKWYKFEPMVLRLAAKTSYKVDFLVINKDSELECHEVKARWSTGKAGWEEDARVKIKVAAEMYPFIFKAVHEDDRGAWVVKEF